MYELYVSYGSTESGIDCKTDVCKPWQLCPCLAFQNRTWFHSIDDCLTLKIQGIGMSVVTCTNGVRNSGQYPSHMGCKHNMPSTWGWGVLPRVLAVVCTSTVISTSGLFRGYNVIGTAVMTRHVMARKTQEITTTFILYFSGNPDKRYFSILSLLGKSRHSASECGSPGHVGQPWATSQFAIANHCVKQSCAELNHLVWRGWFMALRTRVRTYASLVQRLWTPSVLVGSRWMHQEVLLGWALGCVEGRGSCF